MKQALLITLTTLICLQAYADQKTLTPMGNTLHHSQESTPRSLPQPTGVPNDQGPHPYLGVMTGPVAKSLRSHLSMSEEVGVEVVHVDKTSAASEAGLQKYDIITAINEKPIRNPHHLASVIQSYKPGDVIIISYIHKATPTNTTATLLGKKYTASPRTMLRMKLNDMTPQMHSKPFQNLFNQKKMDGIVNEMRGEMEEAMRNSGSPINMNLFSPGAKGFIKITENGKVVFEGNIHDKNAQQYLPTILKNDGKRDDL